MGDGVHSQTPPQCGSGRVTTGPGGLGKHWPIQPTQAPHWVVQGSRGTSGHITVQRSCFMSNNSRSLRIEVAGLNPMACCRNADCGEMSRKTGNAARERKKEKQSVPVARLEKIETESERKMRKSWPRTKRLRMCYWVDSKTCPYKVIMWMCWEGHKHLWFQFTGCLCDINNYFHAL